MVNALKKKILFLAAVLTLSATLFAGCGKSDTNNSATSPSGHEDSKDMPNETELPDNADDGAVKDDINGGTNNGTYNGTNNGDGVMDDAGKAVDDTVNGAGDAVKDAVDGAENAVDDVTGDKNSNKR